MNDMFKYIDENAKDISSLRGLTRMNRREFSDFFGIPYRTVENWEKGTNHCPDYLFNLIKYRICSDHLIRFTPSPYEQLRKPSRIIFLDYDGVVNNYLFGDYKLTGTFDAGIKARFCFPDDNYVNNYQAICWLNKIFETYPFDIVVTSSWRFDDNYAECLYNGGLDPNIRVIGKTKNLKGDRGKEILEWVESHNYTGDFIILDDEEWLYSDKYADKIAKGKNLILVNSETGINFETHKRVCEIFSATGHFEL